LPSAADHPEDEDPQKNDRHVDCRVQAIPSFFHSLFDAPIIARICEFFKSFASFCAGEVFLEGRDWCRVFLCSEKNGRDIGETKEENEKEIKE
jgi:hypothetical protein